MTWLGGQNLPEHSILRDRRRGRLGKTQWCLKTQAQAEWPSDGGILALTLSCAQKSVMTTLAPCPVCNDSAQKSVMTTPAPRQPQSELGWCGLWRTSIAAPTFQPLLRCWASNCQFISIWSNCPWILKVVRGPFIYLCVCAYTYEHVYNLFCFTSWAVSDPLWFQENYENEFEAGRITLRGIV